MQDIFILNDPLVNCGTEKDKFQKDNSTFYNQSFDKKKNKLNSFNTHKPRFFVFILFCFFVFLIAVLGTRKCKHIGNKPGGHSIKLNMFVGCSHQRVLQLLHGRGPPYVPTCISTVMVNLDSGDGTHPAFFIQVPVSVLSPVLPVQPSDWSSRFISS